MSFVTCHMDRLNNSETRYQVQISICKMLLSHCLRPNESTKERVAIGTRGRLIPLSPKPYPLS